MAKFDMDEFLNVWNDWFGNHAWVTPDDASIFAGYYKSTMYRRMKKALHKHQVSSTHVVTLLNKALLKPHDESSFRVDRVGPINCYGDHLFNVRRKGRSFLGGAEEQLAIDKAKEKFFNIRRKGLLTEDKALELAFKELLTEYPYRYL